MTCGDDVAVGCPVLGHSCHGVIRLLRLFHVQLRKVQLRQLVPLARLREVHDQGVQEILASIKKYSFRVYVRITVPSNRLSCSIMCTNHPAAAN